jgi:hypothetical protein
VKVTVSVDIRQACSTLQAPIVLRRYSATVDHFVCPRIVERC